MYGIQKEAHFLEWMHVRVWLVPLRSPEVITTLLISYIPIEKKILLFFFFLRRGPLSALASGTLVNPGKEDQGEELD